MTTVKQTNKIDQIRRAKHEQERKAESLQGALARIHNDTALIRHTQNLIGYITEDMDRDQIIEMLQGQVEMYRECIDLSIEDCDALLKTS